MPLFLVLAGLMLIDTGVRGTAPQFVKQVGSDASAFVAWFAIIVIIGFAGISATLRPLSTIFLVLVVVVFFLRNGQAIAANLKTAATPRG